MFLLEYLTGLDTFVICATLRLEQEHQEIKRCFKEIAVKEATEFTVQQTALRLGVTLKYVRDLLYERRLRGAVKKGRVWRIPAVAVEEWLKAREARNV